MMVNTLDWDIPIPGASTAARTSAVELLLALSANRIEAGDVQVRTWRALEQDPFARLDPERGRFRSYLLTTLQHELVKGHEKRTALKRGGAMVTLALDALDAERDLPALPDDPARAFDRQWALAVMERAAARLAAELEGRRPGSAAGVLRFFSLDEAPSYAEAAAGSGLTPVQFKAALHRARQRFRALVREELSDTVSSREEAEGEMRTLFDALRG